MKLEEKDERTVGHGVLRYDESKPIVVPMQGLEEHNHVSIEDFLFTSLGINRGGTSPHIHKLAHNSGVEVSGNDHLAIEDLQGTNTN
jgi:hypothetical protein